MMVRQRKTIRSKPHFDEQLEKFAGLQQIFVIDNTDPPAEYAKKGIHFTAGKSTGGRAYFPRSKRRRPRFEILLSRRYVAAKQRCRS